VVPFGSFVALGDSFTEGVGDAYADGEACQGWADRFARLLATNLAIRGKLLARRYAVPWLSRRLRGVSSGDGRFAKRPDLHRVG
jgi:lysophospholipase L1-like esterase